MTYDFSKLRVAQRADAVPAVLHVLAAQAEVDFNHIDTELDAFATLIRKSRQVTPRAAPAVDLLRDSLRNLNKVLMDMRDAAITENIDVRRMGRRWWSACIPGWRARLRARATQTQFVELGTDDLLITVNALRNLIREHGQPAGFLNTAVCDSLYTATTNLQNVLAQR